MKNKAYAAIEKYGMLKQNDTVAVGVSGGADSMALLHFLRFESNLKLKITVCHVNHLLRGEESDSDERFVKNICKKWGVGFKCLRCDIVAQSRAAGQSVEEYARRVRYDFFAECALGGKIATAHTLSDAAETLLFNIARGSSVSGLCSIPPVRDNIVRPLIFATRDTVETYCAENGIEFVTDSTNLTDDYSRNKIRHNVVPVLKQINPEFEAAAGRLIGSAMRDEAFLSTEAQKALESAVVPRKSSLGISQSLFAVKAEGLARLDEAVLYRCAREILNRAHVSADSRKINAVKELIVKKSGRICLSGDAFAEVRGGILYLETGRAQEYFEYTLCLSENGVIITDCEGVKLSVKDGAVIGAKRLTARVLQPGADELSNNIHKKALFLQLDCDKIIGNLIIRQKRDGDSIRLRSMTRAVKKMFNEKKLSAYEKSVCPVAADDGGVLGVFGFGAGDRAAVTKSTERVLLLTLG